ncbi:endonuclease III [Holdemania massiliensis]|uniref:Endonuclease III n=1 Tax=Holdemania massiliensis TaxID=1468449 RepID=A0A6N7S948_9FIRM|nr:endonuclease III [Holdemania massiliensis]MSA72053.1 endonuclease III [Holdemania massiliensis]MSA90329.1 endonuclease III [Holdemania massiliensis]MSB79135.1 endonuclease III [Holdemania massiliensis]MSC34059.1 endonuclease III [Holdemania massiliensis]MSC40449.1 endonuclease III [Holdemania massiliensis]
MKVDEILAKLTEMFPDAHCELIHRNPFELAVAVVLSAQTTDVSVNKVTPQLFEKFPTPQALASASLEEIESCIHRIGLYHNKAKSIQGLARGVVEQFDGVMPQTMEELMSLPGVGRKSANVIMSVCFGMPAIAVDTHVERVSKRLRLAAPKDTVLEVEKKLMRKLPKSEWSHAHHLFIFFGRYFCKAKNPQCQDCPFTSFCREYQAQQKQAEKVEKQKRVKAKAA